MLAATCRCYPAFTNSLSCNRLSWVFFHSITLSPTLSAFPPQPFQLFSPLLPSQPMMQQWLVGLIVCMDKSYDSCWTGELFSHVRKPRRHWLHRQERNSGQVTVVKTIPWNCIYKLITAICTQKLHLIIQRKKGIILWVVCKLAVKLPDFAAAFCIICTGVQRQERKWHISGLKVPF